MNIKSSLLAATILSAAVALQVSAGASGAATPGAQAEGQSVTDTRASGVTGISTRAFVGSDVHNVEGERIGEVHDLIVGEDQVATHAVVDVGGFLGVGEKRVLVPFDELDTSGDVGIVVSASREQLETLPAFTYSTTEDYRIDTAQSSQTVTSEEREQFVENTERQLDEWGQKVNQFTENARQEASEASDEAAREVSEAWDAVQRQWRKLKEASVDAWENGKASFDETWNEFEKTWNEAETNKS